MDPEIFRVVYATCLALTMLVAAVWDLRERRIPNAVTVSGFGVALGLRMLPGGLELMPGLLGALIGFGITFPLFVLGGFGGGDAKLMIASGAYLGTGLLLPFLLVVGIVGGLLAVITALRQGVMVAALVNAKNLLMSLLTLGKSGEIRTLETAGALTIPYGVAIAAGALVAWFLPLSSWL